LAHHPTFLLLTLLETRRECFEIHFEAAIDESGSACLDDLLGQ